MVSARSALTTGSVGSLRSRFMASARFLRAKRLLKRLVVGTVALVAALALYLVGRQWTGNFHTLVAGEVYRSAQPTAEAIAAYSKAYGIRTILNLRGEKPHERWYRDEVAAAARSEAVEEPLAGRDDELPVVAAIVDRALAAKLAALLLQVQAKHLDALLDSHGRLQFLEIDKS